jgi:hypothetical protein
MKKLLLSAALFVASFSAFSQVGIGTTTPDTDAALDIFTTDQGVLFPRIALTSTVDAAPLSAYVAGMKVYNTATAGTSPNNVVPGMYYSDGTQWVKYAGTTPEFSPARTVYVDTANPNSATTYDEGQSPFLYDDTAMGCIANTNYVDDPTLADDTANLYVGHSGTCPDPNDGSQYSYWIYDGDNYVPFEASETTEWYLSPTKVDAGSNKTSAIKRDGMIGIGEGLNASDRFAIVAGHVTDRNPRSEAINDTSLLGIYVANRHRGTNTPTGLYGIYNTNYNYSDNDMTTQYATSSTNNHYGTGKITNFRGITSSNTATADSGGFTAGYALIANINNSSTSIDPITTFYGVSSTNTHSGAGRVTNARGGIFSINATNTSGSFNTGYGISNTLTNASPSTTAIATMYGINNDINASSAAVVNAARGINSNLTANAASGGMKSSIGIANVLSNSSTSTDAITTMYGADHNIDAYSAGRITNLRGINLATTTVAGSGSFSAGYGISNVLTNNSAATDVITTMYGVSHDINHSSAGRVTNLRGITSAVNASAASGSFNNGYGIQTAFDNDSDNTTLIAGAYGISSTVTNYGAGDTTTQTGLTTTSYGGNTANDGGVKTMYGINSNTQIRTLNPGALANTTFTGINNAMTQSAIVPSTSVRGYESNNTVSGAGGVTNLMRGFENNNTLSSASTATIGTMDASYNYNLLSGGQSITNMYGVRAYNNINNNANGGTIGSVYGMYSQINKGATGTTTIGKTYGFYYQNNTVAADKNYGLYLESIVGGTTANYAIYSAGGDNYLKGNVLINGATNGVATSELQVVGLPEFATDADAGTAGLTKGAFYITKSHATLPDGMVMSKL